MALSTLLPALAPAQDLEQALGDPFNPDTPISIRSLVEFDEREEAPTFAFERLRGLGVHAQLVPEHLGGRLTSFEELLALVRVLSRRDLVLTTGLGSTALAAIPVWVWGTDEQRREVADLLLRSGAFGCFAVSERDAGSDFLATATRAEAVNGGYRVRGEKWLIGNASRASFVVALVQAQPALSLFFIRPDQLPAGALRRLPKIRTLGLRGHDMGGMVFDDCVLPAIAVVGRLGRGMEMALTTLQYTRTMIGGMAMGAADTALRLAVGWSHARRLYGDSILAIRPIRSLLLGSFLDLLIAECVTVITARALTIAPRRASLWAAITKYLVPNLCERIVRDASVVLSARSYLREGIADGIFQKIARDIAITSIFEGTQLVQLSLIASQLGQLEHTGRRDGESVDLDWLCDLSRPAPTWNPSRTGLRVADPGGDELVDRWFAGDPSSRAGNFPPSPAGEGQGGGAHSLARRNAILHAAASCQQVWESSREVLTPQAASGEWVGLCVQRLLQVDWEPSDANLDGPVFTWMLDQFDRNQMFSILPFEVAQ